MSKKCVAFSKSKLGLETADNRKAFYAGWDAALREALEQPDWEAIGKEQLRRYEEKFGALPQPVSQEPVAWVKFQNGEITHAELSDGSGVDMDLSDWTPLYATPQPTQKVS